MERGNLPPQGETASTRPPELIVASRAADDSLWAEVVTFGGYDVLPQPFERDELKRVWHPPTATLRFNPARQSLVAALQLGSPIPVAVAIGSVS
jgi:hypothetical protein